MQTSQFLLAPRVHVNTARLPSPPADRTGLRCVPDALCSGHRDGNVRYILPTLKSCKILQKDTVTPTIKMQNLSVSERLTDSSNTTQLARAGPGAQPGVHPSKSPTPNAFPWAPHEEDK